MKISLFICVAIGGFLGGISRYFITNWVVDMFPNLPFPIGTYSVNISGCFLIGFFLLPWDAAFQKKHHHYIFSERGQAFVCIGFLSSFTTFSSFGLETYHKLSNFPKILFLDLSLQLMVGIFFVFLGVVLKKRFWKV